MNPDLGDLIQLYEIGRGGELTRGFRQLGMSSSSRYFTCFRPFSFTGLQCDHHLSRKIFFATSLVGNSAKHAAHNLSTEVMDHAVVIQSYFEAV